MALLKQNVSGPTGCILKHWKSIKLLKQNIGCLKQLGQSQQHPVGINTGYRTIDENA